MQLMHRIAVLLLRAGADSLHNSALDVAYASLAVTLDQGGSADSPAARSRYVRRTESKR